jgi:hypothetical protein
MLPAPREQSHCEQSHIIRYRSLGGDLHIGKSGLYGIMAVSLELSHLNQVRAGLNFRFGGANLLFCVTSRARSCNGKKEVKTP